MLADTLRNTFRCLTKTLVAAVCLALLGSPMAAEEPLLPALTSEMAKKISPLGDCQNSLLVVLRDKAGQPLAGVKVLIYDGHLYWAGKKERFESELHETDADGHLLLENLLVRLPKNCTFRVEPRRGEGDKWWARYTYLGTARTSYADTRSRTGDPLIRIDIDEEANNKTVTFTLREKCPFEVPMHDAKTGEIIHMATLLFRDDRVKDWEVAAVLDYGPDNSHELYPFTTFIPEMSDARFMALNEGYYPQEFSLDEELSPEREVVKRIDLVPAPPFALTVKKANGEPAEGARVTYLGPRHRGSHRAPQPADAKGLIEIRYPARGDVARYRIEFEGVSQEFTIAELLEKAGVKSERGADPAKPIEVTWLLP